jgi:ketosteroid isomerase-like protein
MTDHPNAERLRRGYAAYAKGDLATLRGLLADDQHAVALLTGTAERSGKRTEQNVVHVFHTNADGKVIDWWNFWQDQAALGDLFR